MHSTLTEHARCLYGDEYRPAPECDQEHREHYFVEELAFADADEILAVLRELSGCCRSDLEWCWSKGSLDRVSATASPQVSATAARPRRFRLRGPCGRGPRSASMGRLSDLCRPHQSNFP
ncbi:hypothetical protein GTW40_28020 [Streptomyces sp. SID4985]|nr:hypothetical protein [Streptomyces sp. SID4985]